MLLISLKPKSPNANRSGFESVIDVLMVCCAPFAERQSEIDQRGMHSLLAFLCLTLALQLPEVEPAAAESASEAEKPRKSRSKKKSTAGVRVLCVFVKRCVSRRR